RARHQILQTPCGLLHRHRLHAADQPDGSDRRRPDAGGLPALNPPSIKGLRLRLPFRRVAELLCVALVMALLTLFTGDLPQLEVVESTINDDQFTDFVITTRGELPIDTNIVVLTYGPEFLDSFQLVD